MEPDRPTNVRPLRDAPLKRSALRRAALVGVQCVVSLALLAWLFSRPEFRSELRTALAAPHPGWLVAGLLVAGFSHALCFARWAIFVRLLGLAVPVGLLLRAFFSGLFVNIFLPGGAGGDVARVAWLKVAGCDLGPSLLSVVIDRLCGAVSLILLAGILVVPHAGWLAGHTVLSGVFAALGIYLVCLALLLLAAFVVSGRPGRMPRWWSKNRHLCEISRAFATLGAGWRASVWAMGISCTMLLAYFAVFLLAARAYGVQVPAWDFLMLMPVVDVAAGLPLGLGGLGIRETALAFLLSHWGVATGTAVAVSLTGYLLSTAWALPGALPGWGRGGRP